VVRVATAVILGQNLSSLVLLSPHGEPSRGFGNEDGADEDNKWRNDLEGHGKAEGEGAVVLGGGICDSGSQDRAGVEDYLTSLSC
jgi:hypothetical protein